MKLKTLLLLIAVKIICCLPNSVINNRITKVDETNDMTNNYFPEVTYPTSIFEISEPFYYKSHNDDVFGPFSDDVKNSYKTICPKKSITLQNSAKNHEDNLFSIIKNCNKENDYKTQNSSSINLNEHDDSHWVNNEILDKIKNDYENESYVDLTLEEADLQDVNTNYTVYFKENQYDSHIPLNVKLEIGDVKECLNHQSDLITSIFNETLYKCLEDYNIENHFLEEPFINNLMEELNFSLEDNFTQFDENNKTDFENVLSVMLYDYFNNLENISAEFSTLPPQIEESIIIESRDFFENILIYETSIVNNISEEYQNFSSMDTNDKITTEEKQIILSAENDHFLEFIFSLNPIIQNNDSTNYNEETINYQIPSNNSDYVEEANLYTW